MPSKIKINEVNYGFIEPVIEKEHYVLGDGQLSLEKPLRLDGQWDDSVPVDEVQKKQGVETYNCTGAGSTNQTEIYLNAKFGVSLNFSERALGIEAGTRPPGNDPQKVYETIRKKGLAQDSLLPFDDSIKSIDQYYSPNPVPDEVKKSEEGFLNTYNFKHDWVATGEPIMPETMKYALQFSPLGVAVYAWAFDSNRGVFVRIGKDTHWTVCYGFVDGQYWKIFDSYDNTHKKLAWDFGFKYVKRIHITNEPTPEQLSIFETLIKVLTKLVSLLASMVSLKTAQPAVQIQKPDNIPQTPEKPQITPVPSEKPSYLWDTRDNIIVSIKKIAQEENVDPVLACNVAQCESDLVLNKKRYNTDVHQSVDRGLYQWNNYWHPEITDQMAFNPETATRLFCKAVKNGHLDWWNASKNCWKVV